MPRVATKGKCICCGSEFKTKRGNFVRSPLFFYKRNQGFCNICNDCLDAYLIDLVKNYKKTYYEAFRILCATTGIYYNDNLVDQIIRSKQHIITISNYVKFLTLSRQDNKSYIDTIQEDGEKDLDTVTATHIIEKAGLSAYTDDKMQVNEIHDEHGNIDKLYRDLSTHHNLIVFWGSDYEKAEYVQLEKTYQSYISQYECKTIVEQELFKTLCQIKLEAEKARKEGDIKKFKDLTELWQKTMDSANIKPSQKNTNDLSDKQTFGTLIKKWEDTRPISTPASIFQDVDNIKKYISVWFLGCLCNMVGIKNKYYDEYIDELDKYTVKPPQETSGLVDDDSNIEVSDDIFEN